MKLTKKQLKEFNKVDNLRTQMLRKKGKFINPNVWNYGLVANIGCVDSKEYPYGALIYIPYEFLEDLEIQVPVKKEGKNARN